jgi:hypothetical protein
MGITVAHDSVGRTQRISACLLLALTSGCTAQSESTGDRTDSGAADVLDQESADGALVADSAEDASPGACHCAVASYWLQVAGDGEAQQFSLPQAVPGWKECSPSVPAGLLVVTGQPMHVGLLSASGCFGSSKSQSCLTLGGQELILQDLAARYLDRQGVEWTAAQQNPPLIVLHPGADLELSDVGTPSTGTYLATLRDANGNSLMLSGSFSVCLIGAVNLP